MASDIRPTENIIRVIDAHWVRYVMPAVIYALLIAISLLLFYLAGLSAHHYMWLSHGTFIAAMLLFLFAHHWFFAMCLSLMTEHIVITDKRVVHVYTRLLFFDEIQEISHEKMKFVEGEKEGLLQNVLHYGTLWFERKTRIPYVPHPNHAARDIQQSMGRR